MMFCCGSNDKFKDVSCKVDQTDNGVVITVSSDDPKTVESIKKMSDCCDSKTDSNCCG